jgi:DtxR family Mn-dependent transcriptional regulator
MPDPLISLIAGTLLLAVSLLFFWPESGLIGRWRRVRRLSLRVQTEDALKHIYKAGLKGQCPTLHSVAGALHLRIDRAAALLADMQARELVTATGDTLCLTPAGRDAALHIIRAHRLWERHLAEATGFAEAEWHEQAERAEHRLSPGEADALDARLGHPTRDPHGDPIPTATGEIVAHGGQPLTAMPLDAPLRIVHIEDEPEVVYAQLVAEGLYPGMSVRLIAVTPQRVRFWANGDEHVLAPIVAANISAAPVILETAAEAIAGEPLNTLRPGEKGKVTRISPRCRGPERRRLMDLGILPGTIVEAEMTSPTGDPTAYRVRDTLIALRAEQARLIHVDRIREAVA